MPAPAVAHSTRGTRGVMAPLPGCTRLRGSVGQGGANRHDDVRAVQAALNAVVPRLAGASPPLAEDGWIGPKTIGAIRRFQTAWTRVVDGRVDPNGPTIRALNALAGVPAPPSGPATGAMGFTPPSGTPTTLPPPTEAEIRAFTRWNHCQTVVLPVVALAIMVTLRVLTAAQLHLGGQLSRGPGPPPDGLRSQNRLSFLFVAKHFRLHETHPSAALMAVQSVTAVFARMLDAFRTRTIATPLGPRFARLFSLTQKPAHIPNDIAYVAAVSAGGRPPHPTGFTVPDWKGVQWPEISDGIYLLPGYDAVPHLHVPVLMHELAHLSGGQHPDQWVTDQVFANEAAFQAQTTAQRLRNVQCYEFLGIETYAGSTSCALIYPTSAWWTWAPQSAGFGTLVAPEAPAAGADPLAWPAGFA